MPLQVVILGSESDILAVWLIHNHNSEDAPHQWGLHEKNAGLLHSTHLQTFDVSSILVIPRW